MHCIRPFDDRLFLHAFSGWRWVRVFGHGNLGTSYGQVFAHAMSVTAPGGCILDPMAGRHIHECDITAMEMPAPPV